MTIREWTKLLASAGVLTLVAGTALAQQPGVQPAQSQSAEQRQHDMTDCQTIEQYSFGRDQVAAVGKPAVNIFGA